MKCRTCLKKSSLKNKRTCEYFLYVLYVLHETLPNFTDIKRGHEISLKIDTRVTSHLLKHILNKNSCDIL